MSLCLSSSSNRRSRHPSLNLRVSSYFVIHEFISAGRANHYMPSLKTGSIVKVDRFEVTSRIAPIRHLLTVLGSSVQDGVDVRSRPPVLVAFRHVSSTSASPHLKPMTAPSRVVLSTFAVVGIKPHCRVSAPLFPVRHHRQRDPTKR
ncbi:hypothetical protein DY000_02031728 [Brassica cretica]|uniref:Uncharacterized protein n=1 Tax=Brassica cretica TaxID=69181 RepID=A0ABQ7DD13_BRACR|nr:hypothetical protein DY000_02031728 [Brassica cretica]